MGWGFILSQSYIFSHTNTRWEPQNKNEARKAVERKLPMNSQAVLDVFRFGEEADDGSVFSADAEQDPAQTTKTAHGGARALPLPQPNINMCRVRPHTHTHTLGTARTRTKAQEKRTRKAQENPSGAAGQPWPSFGLLKMDGVQRSAGVPKAEQLPPVKQGQSTKVPRVPLLSSPELGCHPPPPDTNNK